MPPAKFCRVPLIAIPIANPEPAISATSDVVSMPNAPITIIISIIVNVMLVKLIINDNTNN